MSVVGRRQQNSMTPDTTEANNSIPEGITNLDVLLNFPVGQQHQRWNKPTQSTLRLNTTTQFGSLHPSQAGRLYRSKAGHARPSHTKKDNFDEPK
ncbi:hypothetical protein Pcinc_041216 [Petrolisthes cinctipes]|uniref:Uncharacterized protein n=1 Tax=Petrolisthes cinctipes TaxID=88211 RepID=A0AAE1BN36_PETCI|nr:hypothetical protein Pcinc_041216 [Petrolisthes cinctipes]